VVCCGRSPSLLRPDGGRRTTVPPRGARRRSPREIRRLAPGSRRPVTEPPQLDPAAGAVPAGRAGRVASGCGPRASGMSSPCTPIPKAARRANSSVRDGSWATALPTPRSSWDHCPTRGQPHRGLRRHLRKRALPPDARPAPLRASAAEGVTAAMRADPGASLRTVGNLVFATKGDLAKVMIQRALESPLPIAWVTADAAYGQEWRACGECSRNPASAASWPSRRPNPSPRWVGSIS
jgi:hypothetical protein